MYSSPMSTPNRKNQHVRDYGSSSFVAGRSPYSPYSSPCGRNETSFNDTDFSFDFDAISQSSNDVLATVDEGLCLDVDNVSTLYNNAADAYSNNKASIFGSDANESSYRLFLTKKRLVCILAPTLAIEFARAFAGLFMLLNLQGFFGYQIGDVSLLLSGVLGTCLVQVVALALRTLKATTTSEPIHKRHILVKYFIVYQLFFITSVAVVIGMSWSVVDLEVSISNDLDSNATTNASHDLLAVSKTPPVLFSILLMIGYVLVTSTAGCGQYVLLSFISHFDPNISPHTASSVIIVWCATGGALSGLAGILVTISNWCPQDDCYDYITAYSAILSSITFCLALMCFLASCGAIYLDTLRDVWERILLYRKTHFFIDPNHKEPQEHEKENSRTAQEDFDECAGLLEASGHSFASSRFTGHSMGSQNTLLDTDVVTNPGTISSANVKMYAHQIPVPVPTLKKMLGRRPFISIVFLVLFLSCLSVIFQYYAPAYLASTVYSYRDSQANISTSTTAHDDADEIAYVSPSVGQDSKAAGLRLACTGTIVYSLVFLVAFVSKKRISNSIHMRLKPWTCSFLLLAMSVFSTTLIATDSGAVYVVTAFIFGMVRLAETEMFHTVARRVDRSWPLVDQDITSTPKAFIWSVAPMSWALSSLLATPLALSSDNTHAPMVCVTALGILLVLGFGMARIGVF